MHRHPFAQAISPSIGDYTQNPSRSKRRLSEAHPSAGKVPLPSSRLPATRPEVGLRKVTCQQFQRRPPCRMMIQDAGVTLTLNGQEENATVPAYGRGGTVDGTVSFANSSNITKVEVRIEGHVTVQELAGNGSADTPVLSELLVFWDAPNRLGGYSKPSSRASTSGAFAPLSGFCPQFFSFKTTLPTQYLEPDGTPCALPPSFAEVLPGVPGFRCAVRYAISVCVTRIRDVRVKSLRAQWKRNMVVRTPVEYRPRTRPSLPAPFPANSKKSSSGPITRFSATIESSSPFVKPIKTMLYLPNSQITPLNAPIPFFLRISGPEATINAYSRPPLSSFLPKAGPDNFTTLCGMIQHLVNDNLHSAKLARVFSLPGGGSSSSSSSSSWSSLLTRVESRTESETRSEGSYEGMEGMRGAQPSTGVRVMLVRQVSVNAHPDRSHHRHRHRPAGFEADAVLDGDYDYGDRGGEKDKESENVRKLTSQIHKSTVLGEGVMYTASVARGCVTWAGEIRVDPRRGIHTGGFRTGNIVVRDMLVVSIRDPNPDVSPLLKFQQVIPVQFTTDAFEQEY